MKTINYAIFYMNIN